MALQELTEIKNTEALSLHEIKEEVARGAKFVVFAYTISLFVVTIRQHSGVYFLKPKEYAIKYSLPFLFISLLLGWWSMRGWIYTLMDIYEAFTGKDFTRETLYALENDKPIAIHLAT